MEPCGTPALIKPNDERWPFRKTLCFLLSRKLVNNCNKLPQIPLQHNLQISPYAILCRKL